jgi:hypothetical protein
MRTYLKEVFLTAWGKYVGWEDVVVRILLVAFVVAGAGTVGAVLDNWRWAFTWVGVGICMVWAAYKTWRVERDKVERYESTELMILAENDGRYIHQRGTNWILRVGVQLCPGRRPVNNVEVKFTERNWKKHAYSDAPLRPAYALRGDRSSFTLKSGDLAFVEVCSWSKGDSEVRIHYHTNYQITLGWFDENEEEGLPKQIRPFVLSRGLPLNEVLTLRAFGENTQPAVKHLVITIDNDEPRWEEVKDGKDAK